MYNRQMHGKLLKRVQEMTADRQQNEKGSFNGLWVDLRDKVLTKQEP